MKKTIKSTYNVISHTHWDREWYFPLEKFRMRLVDMMDHVLEIMESDRDYIFHLDAQTIVLEDYLEIRKKNRNKLEKYVKQGRLIIGPWYVQNDFYLTSGEATIRNLLLGVKIAREYGDYAKIGYAPDQFGNISQLPQILNNFAIDNFIFGRGYQLFKTNEDVCSQSAKPDTGLAKESVTEANRESQGESKRESRQDLVLENQNTEFLWEGPDGSQLTAVYMKDWYNNAQRFSKDIDKSMELLEQIEISFRDRQMTGELLLMNGVDHLEAQEDLLPILEEMNKRLPADQEILQTSMARYMDRVKTYFEQHPAEKEKLKIFKGELRKGLITNILQNTLSARPQLKRENFRLQNMLEKNLEPLYVLMELIGNFGRYPAEYMEYLWKELIKNHPHDSICGCSHDFVHANMEDRFNRISVTARELLDRGLDFLAAHVNRSFVGEKDGFVLLVNTQADSRSEVINMPVAFPADQNVNGFALINSRGEEVAFTGLKREKVNKNIYSPINLPGVKEVHEYMIQFQANNIPGLGYEIYRVIPHSVPLEVDSFESERVTEGVLENEFLKLEISRNGNIGLYHKESSQIYPDIHQIIDEADVGDAYRNNRPANSKIFSTSEVTPVITLEVHNDFEKTYKISYVMMLPLFYDFDRDQRSDEKIQNRVDLFLSLKKGMPWCEWSYRIDNKSKDHRLRVLFTTGINENITMADSPFDLIARDRRNLLEGITTNGDQPNSGYVSLKSEKRGAAVFNRGVYEYEHYLGQEGILAFTLVRSAGYISRDASNLEKLSPAMITPEGECLRVIEQDLALRPFVCHDGGSDEARTRKEVLLYQNPLLACYQPVDLTAFNGGRPAVQGSCVSEIFYRDDPWASVQLPYLKSMINLEGDSIILSALKMSEGGDGFVMRVFNISDNSASLNCSFHSPVEQLQRVNMMEETLEDLEFYGNRIKSLTLGAKEILTMKFKLKGQQYDGQ